MAGRDDDVRERLSNKLRTDDEPGAKRSGLPAFGLLSTVGSAGWRHHAVFGNARPEARSGSLARRCPSV